MHERLLEIVNKGMAYYNSDPRNEFKGVQQLDINYTREQRLAFIKALVAEIEELPLIRIPNEGCMLNVEEMSEDQRNLVKFITLDLNAKALRGTLSGCKLKPLDLPYINKWNPLVMYVLSKKYGLKTTDFIVRSNNGKHFLGKDLMSLLIIINEEDAHNVSKYGSYFIDGFSHKIVKDELEYQEELEQGTDITEDRINYNKKGNQIIRNYSPWTLTYLDEYTKEYDKQDIKLSKEYMRNLVFNGIINKRGTKVPEGCEF